jgi:predicted permease
MTDFRLPSLDIGERVYRALLLAYPREFRRAFDRDLVETFRDERRAARREGVPAFVFWGSIVPDVITQGAAERVNVTRHAPHDEDREGSLMTALQQMLSGGELRAAVRRLRRAPAFSAATLVVLGLGIAVTTTIFSLVNGVLLRPLPYAEPQRLVAIMHNVQVDGVSTLDQSDAGIMYYQEHARAFESSGGWHDRDVNVAPPADMGRQAERISGAEVTANLFDVLGVRPVIGRTFRAGEDRVGAAPAVILSDRLWQRYFHGDASAVGKLLVIDGVSRQIVGVMPDSFRFIKSAPELWYPIALDRKSATVGSFNYRSVARLRDGETIAAARADLVRILPNMIDEFPSGIPRAMWAQAHIQPVLVPLHEYVVGDTARLLWILLASAALVLVIACANVASLFLVRGDARQLELAIRGALGSGLAGMVGSAISESFVLAAAGGLLGVAIATVAVRTATVLGATLGMPRLDQVMIDGRVLSFAIATSVACGFLVSVFPLARARRIPIGIVLREAGRTGTAGRARQHARSVLVIAQIGLGLVLVASSALLARSFMRLRDVRPGFEPHGVFMARFVLPPATYPTRRSVELAQQRVLAAVRAIPGVASASFSDMAPLTDDGNTGTVSVEDHPLPPNVVPRVHTIATVDPDYFRTMGIPILTGSTLPAPDVEHPAADALVSRSFAERYWPGASPLGKRIRVGINAPWFTIVGEVGDVHYDGLDKPANEAIYLPRVVSDSVPDLTIPRYATLFVGAGDRTAGLSAAIRGALRSVDPGLPTYDEHTLDQIVANATARARVTLVLLIGASVIALMLGAVGIYGVMAYAVSLRQREIGVRIALGAQPSEVRRMISFQGLRLALAGIVVGAVCAAAVTRVLRGLLFEISPTDPIALGGTCAALFAIALLASWGPARRAASIDPAEALRRG